MSSHTNRSSLRFDARDLSPFQECVDEKDLREGEIYFTVSFLDEDMAVPELKPVVFLGRQLDGDNVEGMLYFPGLRFLSSRRSLDRQSRRCERRERDDFLIQEWRKR